MLEKALCSVCNFTFGMDNRIAAMPCGHAFHKDCLNSWLQQGNENSTCPYCGYISKMNEQPLHLIFNTENEEPSSPQLSPNQIKNKLKQLELFKTILMGVKSEAKNILKDDAVFSSKQMAYSILLQLARSGESEDMTRNVDLAEERLTKLKIGYETCKQAYSIQRFTEPELLFTIAGLTVLCFALFLRESPLDYWPLLMLHCVSMCSYMIMLIHITLTVGWIMIRIHPLYQASFGDIQKILFPKSFGYAVLFSGMAVASVCCALMAMGGYSIVLLVVLAPGMTVSFITSVTDYRLAHANDNSGKLRITLSGKIREIIINLSFPVAAFIYSTVALWNYEDILL